MENSIRHGLEPKREGGSITVQARRVGHRVTLDVVGTGVGLNRGALSDADSNEPASRFGLTQVRERLATAYGNHDAIFIIANYEEGTRARITFYSKNATTQPNAQAGRVTPPTGAGSAGR